MEWKVEKKSTLILAAMISNRSHFLKNVKGHDGFSMLEILVAISLVGIIFMSMPSGTFDTERENLESTYETLQRVIRSASDEAILRNSVVRVKIEYGEDKWLYTIEYGEGTNLVLPQAKDLSRMSIKEREEAQKISEKFDSQFTKSNDFADAPGEFPEGIELYGVGTTYLDALNTISPYYIYFFPTGDKDAAFLIFYSLDEILTVETFPFEDKTNQEFIQFSNSELANIEDAVENKANDLFESWYRNEK